MFKGDDQPEVKRALSILAGATLFAALMLGSAYWYRASEIDAENRAKRNLQRIEFDISQAQERQDLLLEYQDAFLALLEGGVVGEERRLSWIETLKQNGNQYRIPKIKYRIDTRNIASLDDFGYMAESSEPPTIFRTRMELDMDLLHEVEVLALLDALSRDAQGMFTIDRCDVTRSAEALAWDLSTNFRGICALDWYTIKRPNPTDEVL